MQRLWNWALGNLEESFRPILGRIVFTECVRRSPESAVGSGGGYDNAIHPYDRVLRIERISPLVSQRVYPGSKARTPSCRPACESYRRGFWRCNKQPRKTKSKDDLGDAKPKCSTGLACPRVSPGKRVKTVGSSRQRSCIGVVHGFIDQHRVVTSITYRFHSPRVHLIGIAHLRAV